MLILSVPVIPFVMMGVLAVGIITTAAIALTVAIKRNKEIEQNGICVDAVVVSNEDYRRDGNTYYRTTVRFVGNDGQEHDCMLEYRGGMPVGRRMKVQYIPGKYDHVLFISQEIGSENN